MAGVSTESLSKVEEVLEAHASLQPLKLASELFALVDVLDHNGTLRRAITDSSRGAAARQGIANSVFDGKISSQTMAVLTTAVSQRWSEDEDLADALERAAVLAVAASAQSRGGVDALDEVLNELLTFVRTVDSNAQAQEALSDHQASKEAQKKLAVALGGPAAAEGVLLLERVGSHTRSRHAARVADDFAEIIVTRQNRYIARVTSAITLSQAQFERLGRALNAVYGRELKLDVSVDPAVLGGLRVQVGDEVIDGTVETRMSDLTRSIG